MALSPTFIHTVFWCGTEHRGDVGRKGDPTVPLGFLHSPPSITPFIYLNSTRHHENVIIIVIIVTMLLPALRPKSNIGKRSPQPLTMSLAPMVWDIGWAAADAKPLARYLPLREPLINHRSEIVCPLCFKTIGQPVSIG